MFDCLCDTYGTASQVGCVSTTSKQMSAPELPAPTSSTPPGCSCDGFLYAAECTWTMCGSRSSANAGVFGSPYEPVATMTLDAVRSPAVVSMRNSSPSLLSRLTVMWLRTGSSCTVAYVDR